MQFVPLYGWIIEATVTFFLLLLLGTIEFVEQVVHCLLQQLQLFVFNFFMRHKGSHRSKQSALACGAFMKQD